MSARPLEFIQQWIEENLAHEPSSDHIEDADMLARRCLKEAEAKGIPRSEIEEEIGDLGSFIKEALESTADEEGETTIRCRARRRAGAFGQQRRPDQRHAPAL